MGDEIQIKIEEAKSWFVLAQIFIILAGFMFAISGIYYNASLKSNEDIRNKGYEFIKNGTKLNLEDEYGNQIYEVMRQISYQREKQEKEYNEYKKIGLSLTGISLLFWLIGYSKFSRRINSLPKKR